MHVILLNNEHKGGGDEQGRPPPFVFKEAVQPAQHARYLSAGLFSDS